MEGLKSKDFRIGNLVLRADGWSDVSKEKAVSFSDTIYEVDSIRHKLIGLHDYPEMNGMHDIKISDILGIQINEEHLLKLGFKNNGTVYKNDWIEIWFSSNHSSYQLRLYKVGDDIAKSINISHIHELQNIVFFINGKELVYDDPK